MEATMSIRIAATILVGTLLLSALMPLSVLQDKFENKSQTDDHMTIDYVARLALSVTMISAGALQAVLMVIHYFCPKYSVELKTHHSKAKLTGIWLFCVFGVYTIDILYIIAGVVSQCQIQSIYIIFHVCRIVFSSISALFCVFFRKRSFFGHFIALFTLSITCVTPFSLWFELVLDENHFNQTAIDDFTPIPLSNLSSITNTTKLQVSSVSESTDEQISFGEKSIECIERPLLTMMNGAKPYLYPFIVELMMLFAESYATWFFGCILINNSQSRKSGYEPIAASNPGASQIEPVSNLHDNASDEDNREEYSENSPLVDNESHEGSSPTRQRCLHQPVEQQHHHHQQHINSDWSMCDSFMAMTTFMLSTGFVVVGVLFYHKKLQMDKAFGVFRIVFWVIFSLLAMFGYLGVRWAKIIQWVDGKVTGFEYFIVVCHVCVTLFSAFKIAATLASNNKHPHLVLFLVEAAINIGQICSQVLFYFWVRGMQRPSDELCGSNRRVRMAYLLLKGIVISLAILNVAMWIEDSFVETAPSASTSFEKEFVDRWPTIYSALGPIRLLFRFNSAMLFYELHHRFRSVSG
jgi:hypothetical protein